MCVSVRNVRVCVTASVYNIIMCFRVASIRVCVTVSVCNIRMFQCVVCNYIITGCLPSTTIDSVVVRHAYFLQFNTRSLVIRKLCNYQLSVEPLSGFR